MNQPYESILPSYVMDVYSYGSINDFPTIGDPGMLYIDISKRAVYRYNGEDGKSKNYSCKRNGAGINAAGLCNNFNEAVGKT